MKEKRNIIEIQFLTLICILSFAYFMMPQRFCNYENADYWLQQAKNFLFR